MKLNTHRARIAQIDNDISEDCVEATNEELIDVIRYYQDRCNRFNNLLQKKLDEVLMFAVKLSKKRHP